MTTLHVTPQFEINRSPDRIALLLLLGLLGLRLPLLAGVRLFVSPPPDWLSPVFELGTYLLTVSLVWWERARLADFHIDTLAIAIIIIAKPIETLILTTFGSGPGTFPLAFPGIPALVIWFAAIGLFLALLRQRPRLPGIQKKALGWFVVGMLVGTVTAFLLAYPMSLQMGSSERPASLPPPDLQILLVQGFIYQLGYAAVSEEPLFRGFLWGYLRKAKWRDGWIWLFQAGLFWLGHIYYFGKLPISFWLVAPAGGLILGWLAWRSRSITTSLAAHAAVNGLAAYFAYIIMFYQR